MLAKIEELVKLVEYDGDLLEEITGTQFDTLIENINKQPLDFQKRIVSQEKFISSELNKQGLHLFRCLAAEFSVNKRRDDNLLYNNKYYGKWMNDGILRFDNVWHWFEKQDDELYDILSMCAGCKVEKQPWRENNFVHHSNDIQYELHTDIFQPNVKSWMYLQDIELKHGPTYFIRGSHINDEKKLRWLYEMSNLPAGHPDIREGSFPIKNYKKWGFDDPIPIVGPKGTYFICDTSGLHCRGVAAPGILRKTAKLHYRYNPFDEK